MHFSAYLEHSSFGKRISSASFCLLYLLLHDIARISCQITRKYIDREIECPEPGAKMMMNDVAWGTPYRAYLTVPKGLKIAPSIIIPEAGLGVLSDTFIPKYTWLGEYDGEMIPASWESSVGSYAWNVRRGDMLMGLIDGEVVERTTHLRFVNMPKYASHENVLSLECYTKIFYITIKDIAPGMELFVDYGPNYALNMGADLNEYFEVHEKWLELGIDLNKRKHRQWIYRKDLELNVLRTLHPKKLPSVVTLLKMKRELDKKKQG